MHPQPCPSFCGAASCGAVRSLEHTAAVSSSSCSTGYDTDTRFMYVFCVLVFLVSSVDCPLGLHAPRPPANIARTAVQSVTSRSTQHSAGQLALHKHLLALLSIRYSHQKITGLFFLPHVFTVSVSCIVSFASVAGGVSSLAERSPVLSFESHRVPPGTVGTCVCSSFCFFVVGFVLHLGTLRDFFFANYTRITADQNVSSLTYAQHRQGNQLRTSSSCH